MYSPSTFTTAYSYRRALLGEPHENPAAELTKETYPSLTFFRVERNNTATTTGRLVVAMSAADIISFLQSDFARKGPYNEIFEGRGAATPPPAAGGAQVAQVPPAPPAPPQIAPPPARAWPSLYLHTALAAGISALAQLQILAAMRGDGVQMRSLRCEKSKSSLRAKSANHTHTAPLSTQPLVSVSLTHTLLHTFCRSCDRSI